jgi:cell division initiation protein
LIKENLDLRQKVLRLESTVVDYKDMERAIQEVLLTAQKSAEEVKKNAEKEAELSLREAKIRSERMLEETHAMVSELRKEIAELENLKKSYILRLKSSLDTQLKILESMEQEE